MTANPGEPEVANTHARPVGRIPADTFSNRLVLARRLAGLTITEAAAAARLKSSSWSNWENGMRPQDLVETCGRISQALDVDFNWLLLGGPLAGPHGPSTGRSSRDTFRYPHMAERPIDNRPNGRPAPREYNPVTRRAVRIQWSGQVAA